MRCLPIASSLLCLWLLLGQGAWAGVTLDGTDDLLTVANEGTFDFANTSFTVCFWYSTTVNGTPLAKNNQNGAVDGWYVRVSNTFMKTNAAPGAVLAGTVVVTTGTPQHACIVFTTSTTVPGNNVILHYNNGVLDAGEVLSVTDIYTPNNVAVTVGARSTGGFFNGQILQVRVYPGVLSAAAIAVLAAGRQRQNSLAVQPLLDLPLSNCVNGTGGNGIIFADQSGSGNTATGSFGANATGLTCLGDTYLQGRGVE